MIEGIKLLLDGSIGIGTVVLMLYLVRNFYESQVKGEIHAAKIAANAAQDEARKARDTVIEAHSSLRKSITDHYESFLEVKALAKNADENTQRLGKLASQLASSHIKIQSEIKKINDDLIIIKQKKG